MFSPQRPAFKKLKKRQLQAPVVPDVVSSIDEKLCLPPTPSRRWCPAVRPSNEPDRAAEAKALTMLIEDKGSDFDQLTWTLAKTCGKKWGAVTFIEADRLVFMSLGNGVRSAPRETSFTTHCILHPGKVFMVKDLSKDPRFAENPYVIGEPKVRFFAGYPIVINGRAVGTISVMDLHPGTLNDDQLITLQVISEAVRDMLLLRRNSSMLQNFVATIAHELRTPANAILGFSKLLGEQCHPWPTSRTAKARVLDHISSIHAGAENLAETINEVLDFSKLQAGFVRPCMKNIDIHKMMSGILRMHEAFAKEKRVTVSMEIKSVEDWIVQDERLISRVIHNLLSNAIKFTTEEKEVQVTLRGVSSATKIVLPVTTIFSGTCDLKTSDPKGKHKGLVLTVRDQGVGIAKDQIRRIFGQYVQHTKEITRKYEGTGLGLAIVKELMYALNGKIYVNSVVNEGSTFSVFIPYTIPDGSKPIISYKKPPVSPISGGPRRLLRAQEKPPQGTARRVSQRKGTNPRPFMRYHYPVHRASNSIASFASVQVTRSSASSKSVVSHPTLASFEDIPEDEKGESIKSLAATEKCIPRHPSSYPARSDDLETPQNSVRSIGSSGIASPYNGPATPESVYRVGRVHSDIGSDAPPIVQLQKKPLSFTQRIVTPPMAPRSISSLNRATDTAGTSVQSPQRIASSSTTSSSMSAVSAAGASVRIRNMSEKIDAKIGHAHHRNLSTANQSNTEIQKRRRKPKTKEIVEIPSWVVVLCAEDDRMSRKLISRFFKRAGIEVRRFCEDGKVLFEEAEALLKSRQCKSIIVFTDVHMPRMNGIELLQSIRKQPWPLAPEIIANTASPEALKNENPGFDKILRKPLSPKIVTTEMKHAVERILVKNS
uniref:histidine kinase n=1 Tax=Lotharella globosa TaxID=91324 RepID=A0A7S3ZAM9_9EUKA